MENPINIKLINRVLPLYLDLVICSASFETRCQKLIETLNNQLICKEVWISYNSNEYKEINNKALELIEKTTNAVELELNSDLPMQNAVTINKKLEDFFQGTPKNIFLDTSTFTHETLLIFYKLIYEKRERINNFYIGYNTVIEYSVNEMDLEKKWLSSGISEIRSIVGYPGVSSPARKNHLIVLVGFEYRRTQSLIDDLQFDTISLGFGNKKHSIGLRHQELNYKRHLELIKKYCNADQFCFSLINPIETEKDLINQINKFPNHNTVIAPMNNKISTIGASLVAINNQKIQLIYAKPIEYNINGYSKPSDDVYIFKMI